jgi:hypothetical protein
MVANPLSERARSPLVVIARELAGEPDGGLTPWRSYGWNSSDEGFRGGLAQQSIESGSCPFVTEVCGGLDLVSPLCETDLARSEGDIAKSLAGVNVGSFVESNTVRDAHEPHCEHGNGRVSAGVHHFLSFHFAARPARLGSCRSWGALSKTVVVFEHAERGEDHLASGAALKLDGDVIVEL